MRPGCRGGRTGKGFRAILPAALLATVAASVAARSSAATSAAPGRAGAVAAPAALARLDEARIDAAFAGFARGGSPGCATGIVADGRLAWAKGYGLASLEHGVPITPATVFDLGSTSKQVTAAALALLARDGRLSPDDDVRKFVPELPDYGATITLRHLLTHTSGLRDYTDLLSLSGRREEDLATTADAIAILARQRGVNFAPGAEYRYCNSGFFLASVVVERVSGKSLRAFAKERLLGPLGMGSSLFFDDHALVVPRRARGYAPRPEGGFRSAASDWEQVGDGGLQSSVEDMARWVALFENGAGGSDAGGSDAGGSGAAGSGADGSAAESLHAAWLRDTLETPARLDDGTTLRYGLGLALDTHRGLRIVQHGGAWAGYRAMTMRAPERRLAVITLCNTAAADTTALSLATLDTALDALSDPPPPVVVPGGPPPALAGLEPLAGTYYNEARGEVLRVRFASGALRLGEEEEGEPPLVAAGDRRFVTRDGRREIAFAGGGAGLSLRSAGGGDPRPVAYRRAGGHDHPSAGSLRGLAGDYASAEIGPALTVRVREGTPHVTLPGGESLDLAPIARDLFDAGWGVVRLHRDADGRPASLAFTSRGVVDLRFARAAPAADSVAAPGAAAAP